MLQGIWNGRDTACKVKQEHKYKDQIEMSVENKVSLELCLKKIIASGKTCLIGYSTKQTPS